MHTNQGYLKGETSVLKGTFHKKIPYKTQMRQEILPTKIGMTLEKMNYFYEN